MPVIPLEYMLSKIKRIKKKMTMIIQCGHQNLTCLMPMEIGRRIEKVHTTIIMIKLADSSRSVGVSAFNQNRNLFLSASNTHSSDIRCLLDGRMEDGYLAWSSIYFHDYFGCTIYTPLTPEEQDKMKQDKYIPNWMEDFTSLPNLAIPISYFCIGVALQLLRTPLIVYFIQDQGASAAEVNVLFTVSKLHSAEHNIFNKKKLTVLDLFAFGSGRSMVFQGHIWFPLRLPTNIWTTQKTIFHDWMAHIHCGEFCSHDSSSSEYWNVHLSRLRTNSWLHAGRCYD